MMIPQIQCPDCRGDKLVNANLTRYGDREETWEDVVCPTCEGFGECSEEDAEAYILARESRPSFDSLLGRAK